MTEEWTPEKIDGTLETIYLNKDHEYHKAYFQNDHPLHAKVVGIVETLSRMKIGDEPFAPEVMPVISKLGEIKIK